MKIKPIVLVVDDSYVDRKVLNVILSEEYIVEETESASRALTVLFDEKKSPFNAVFINPFMSDLGGFEFLERLRAKGLLDSLPVIVVLDTERKSEAVDFLRHGARNFVLKPYNAELLRFRLEKELKLKRLEKSESMKNEAECDTLTGLFNKRRFLSATNEMLLACPEKKFAVLRLDVDRFALLNMYFGEAEGDRLLIYISNILKRLGENLEYSVFGRMYSDVFFGCVPAELTTDGSFFNEIRLLLEKFRSNYRVVPSFGVYVVEDRTETVEQMMDKARIASKKCKNNYMAVYAFYDAKMGESLLNEQRLVNEMNRGLDEGQFEVFLQPKFNLSNYCVSGAEALVRWRHPDRGLLPPAEFVPVFESNGFIMRLDAYVWERVCRLLAERKAAGKPEIPVSVNISRVDLYNPLLCSQISDLADKYDIDHSLLHLEVTETAYMSDPNHIGEVSRALQSAGFKLLMDDFGSGYSSLNMLKDIDFDILKIDMRFLSDSENEAKGKNILTSVVRMAKWLDLPIIVEGVELQEQAEYLRGLGCEEAQGYFFAKPMPVEEFEKIEEFSPPDQRTVSIVGDVKVNDVWSPNAQANFLFNNIIGAIGLFELFGNRLEIIRVNEGLINVFGKERRSLISKYSRDILKLLEKDQAAKILESFKQSMLFKAPTECVYRFLSKEDNSTIWCKTRICYVAGTEKRHLFYATAEDVTHQINAEFDLQLQEERIKLLSKNSAMLTFDYNSMTDTLDFSAFDAQKQMRTLRQENYLRNLDKYKNIYYEDLPGLKKVFGSDERPANGVLSFRANFLDTGLKRYSGSFARVNSGDGNSYRVVGIMFESNELGVNQFRDLNNLINAVVYSAPVAFLRLRIFHDKSIELIYVNDRFLGLSGMSKTDARRLYGKRRPELLVEFFDEEEFSEVSRLIEEAILKREKSVLYCGRITTKTGELYLNCGIGLVYLDDCVEANVSGYDVTELMLAKKELETQRNFISNIYNSIPCGIMQFETANKIKFLNANRAAIEILGFTEEEFWKQDRYYLDFVKPEFIPYAIGELMKLEFLPLGKSIVLELPIVSATGREVWVRDDTQIVIDEKGKRIYQCVFNDISSSKEQESKLLSMSNIDTITNIYNRRAFEQVVSEKISLGQHGAFCVLDLDDFKRANDSYGHSYGDKVLTTVAEILKSVVRKRDVISRLGGDEFALFLDGAVEIEEIKSRCEELCSAFRLFDMQKKNFSLSCSIGVAVSSDGSRFGQLYGQADKALYRAKELGKNRFEIF